MPLHLYKLRLQQQDLHAQLEVLELGVVNRTIHKVNECVSVADVDALHRTYVGMFERLLPAA